MKAILVAPLLALCLAAAGAGTVRAAPAPVKMQSGLNATRATIPVSIDGTSLRCVLDTGSSAILVSPAVAHVAGLRAGVGTFELAPNGHTYADRQTRIARFAAGGHLLRNVAALVSSNLRGREVLCGYDFFAHVPTLIDRSRQTVTLFPSAAQLRGLKCLPVDLSARVPVATVEINDTWVRHVVLDSGMVGGGALWDGVRPQLRRPLVARADYETDPSAVRDGLACGATASIRFFPGGAIDAMRVCTEPQRPDGYNGIIETNLPTIYAMAVDYPHRRICFGSSGHSELVSSRRPSNGAVGAWSRFNRLRGPP